MFKKLKPFRFQLFKHYPTFLLRGLVPAPLVSLATPRGQGSPLRFDTQPTGWSVGSATRHQGGVRKDCSAALLNLYKASPLTPFRFPPKPNSGGFGRRARRAGGESPALQVSANVPGWRAGKVRRCRFWPASPEGQAGKVRRCRFWQASPEEQAGKVQRCRFWPAFPNTKHFITSAISGFCQHLPKFPGSV